MTRDVLADVTYEAGFRLNRLKREMGLISLAKAEETEARIGQARQLMQQIESLMHQYEGTELDRALLKLKPQIDKANTSTVCDKSELDVKVGLVPFKLLNLARIGFGLDTAQCP